MWDAFEDSLSNWRSRDGRSCPGVWEIVRRRKQIRFRSLSHCRFSCHSIAWFNEINSRRIVWQAAINFTTGFYSVSHNGFESCPWQQLFGHFLHSWFDFEVDLTPLADRARILVTSEFLEDWKVFSARCDRVSLATLLQSAETKHENLFELFLAREHERCGKLGS